CQRRYFAASAQVCSWHRAGAFGAAARTVCCRGSSRLSLKPLIGLPAHPGWLWPELPLALGGALPLVVQPIRNPVGAMHSALRRALGSGGHRRRGKEYGLRSPEPLEPISLQEVLSDHNAKDKDSETERA